MKNTNIDINMNINLIKRELEKLEAKVGILERERENSYHAGYRQGRFDVEAERLHKPYLSVGDAVVVVESDSIPESYLGMYGVIREIIPDPVAVIPSTNDYLDYLMIKSSVKYVVEFRARMKGKGSLSHTARASDLMRIGSMNM